MKKLFLGMAACLCVGLISLAKAQDSENAPSKLLVYPKDKTQRELGLYPFKHVRQPLPPMRARKLKSLNNSTSGKNSIVNQATGKIAAGPGKDQLVDKNGKPVTLWPAGQKKHYSTIYQDPRN